LCLLVEVKADFLADPQICQFVIEFLLWTTEHDTDYDVKKEACEFWSSLCENEEVILYTHTHTHLNARVCRFVPIRSNIFNRMDQVTTFSFRIVTQNLMELNIVSI
jgi:hypothetical protein